eukprot:2634581-Pyramimonas_sp.AAC.1
MLAAGAQPREPPKTSHGDLGLRSRHAPIASGLDAARRHVPINGLDSTLASRKFSTLPVLLITRLPLS